MTSTTATLAETASTLSRPAPNVLRFPRVESWELIEPLGQGRLGIVHRARPVGTPHADYALKQLRPVWDDVPEAQALLAREAEVGREVQHPQLVPILDHQLHRAPRFVVMPCLQGQRLDGLARDGRPLLPEALWYARQAAEALSALHTADWRHGDVKPGNLFVSGDGHVTLLDLGFARRLKEAAPLAASLWCGTPRYIAPECLMSRLRVDHRADLYSLGATLYELLAGRPPFVGATYAEIARQHRQERPTDLRAIVPQLPRNVVELVRDLLAKDPQRRPETAEALINRLARLEIESLTEWSPEG